MNPHPGFSLIELLVVVTIIVVLLALLTPAMDRAMEQAERVVCAANQHVIQAAAYQYGMQNRKFLFICSSRTIPVAFNIPEGIAGSDGFPGRRRPGDRETDWMFAMSTVGLASSDELPIPPDPYETNTVSAGVGYLPGKMWDCPSRGQKSYYDLYPQGVAVQSVIVGYMYYGGLDHWVSPHRSPTGFDNPPTPKKINDKSHWALTSDVTAKYNGAWNRAGVIPHFKDVPPHIDGPGDYPAGHNQSFLDGSVQWIDADRLIMFHSWNNTANQLYFYWQSNLGRLIPDHNDYLRNQ